MWWCGHAWDNMVETHAMRAAVKGPHWLLAWQTRERVCVAWLDIHGMTFETQVIWGQLGNESGGFHFKKVELNETKQRKQVKIRIDLTLPVMARKAFRLLLSFKIGSRINYKWHRNQIDGISKTWHAQPKFNKQVAYIIYMCFKMHCRIWQFQQCQFFSAWQFVLQNVTLFYSVLQFVLQSVTIFVSVWQFFVLECDSFYFRVW